MHSLLIDQHANTRLLRKYARDQFCPAQCQVHTEVINKTIKVIGSLIVLEPAMLVRHEKSLFLSRNLILALKIKGYESQNKVVLGTNIVKFVFIES